MSDKSSFLPLDCLRRLVKYLSPEGSGLVAAFAYGSAAFPQHGRTTANSQLDIILIVNDSVHWHMENLARNPLHYNFLMRYYSRRATAPPFMNFLLTKLPGSKIYYNPFVSWYDSPTDRSLVVKYGVIDLSSALTDLNTWSHLYLAGRLHKPVIWLPVRSSSCTQQLVQSQTSNLTSAVVYALLCLCDPRTGHLNQTEFFHTIAGISYHGDWRMIIGEDKSKVMRLVTGGDRLNKFLELYSPILTEHPFKDLVLLDPDSSRLIVKEKLLRNSDIVYRLLNSLPDRICSMAGGSQIPQDARVQLLGMAHLERRAKLQTAVAQVVRRSSLSQTALGIFSAGPLNSTIYAVTKLRKMLASSGVLRW